MYSVIEVSQTLTETTKYVDLCLVSFIINSRDCVLQLWSGPRPGHCTLMETNRAGRVEASRVCHIQTHSFAHTQACAVQDFLFFDLTRNSGRVHIVVRAGTG